MHTDSWTDEDLVFEPDYNVHGHRLPRLDGAQEPYAGGAWVVVPEGATMTSHVNPGGESELFFVLDGTGIMEITGERRRVKFGDTVFIPPDQAHTLVNDGKGRLVFLSLWWGGRNG